LVATAISKRSSTFYNGRTTCVFLCVAALITATGAQKVKVGHDASTDFSKYNTYSWAESVLPPTQPPLYATAVESIDTELSSKGLQKVDKDGDITLIGAGGVEYGNNTTGEHRLSPPSAG
jgi:NADPH:quinone reductase-like Zn-dependent oxidoreductase